MTVNDVLIDIIGSKPVINASAGRPARRRTRWRSFAHPAFFLMPRALDPGALASARSSSCPSSSPTQRSLPLADFRVRRAERLRWSGPPNEKEETTRLITRFELASRSKAELHALKRSVADDLARSNPGTAERRSALASMENLDAELRARAPKRRSHAP